MVESLNIPIKCESNFDYYRRVITVLRLFPPYHQLDNKEAELLVSLLTIEKEYTEAGIPIDAKRELLLSYTNKQRIARELNFSRINNVNDFITRLRKLGFIEGRYLSDKVLKFANLKDINIIYDIKK